MRKASSTSYVSASLIDSDHFEEKRRRDKRDWKVIATIFFTFLLGLAAAIGHDACYRFLEGKVIDNVYFLNYGIRQKWVSYVGTAFTFLVKSLLVAAIGVTYNQLLWKILTARTTQVGHIDVLTDPRSPASFFLPKPWLRFPGLLLLALVMWCIPIAVIFAPTTLIVANSYQSETLNLTVPALSFHQESWTSNADTWSKAVRMCGKPTVEVKNTGLAAVNTGRIQTFSHTFPNESYVLDYYAPALQCSFANASVNARVAQALQKTSYGGYNYAAWVGNDDHGLISGNLSTGDPFLPLDYTSNDSARIFIMSYFNTGLDSSFKSVSECALYNASYSVNFTIVNGISTTAVKQIKLREKMPARTQADSDPLEARCSYQAVMSVYGTALVGVSANANYTTRIQWTPNLTNTQRQLEELFQNMTLSMFSEPKLLLDTTRTPKLPVTVTSNPLTYQYQPKNLWISYGAAVLVTLITVLVGLQIIYSSGLCYSSTFSTIMRVTKDSDVYALVDQDDDGSQPLPKAIERHRMSLGNARQRSLNTA